MQPAGGFLRSTAVLKAATVRRASIDRPMAKDLSERGVIGAGMLPKLSSAFNALEAGVHKVHMIDGRVKHSLLLEIFTDEGVGTQIVPQPEERP